MKHKNLVFLLALAILSNLSLNAQTFSGVFGKKNIAGFKFDLIFEPISLYKHVYYERMIDRRRNLGISFHFGNATHSIDQYANYISPNYNITTSINNVDRTVVDIGGDFQQKKSGFEVYIKRFSKRNPMRNYGLYWSYKFGQIRAVNIFKEGSDVEITDPNNANYTEIFKTQNDSRSISKRSYVGFELGKSVPFFKDGLMLTYSVSVNGFLQPYDEIYNTSLGNYLKNYGDNYINNTHIMSVNVGWSYAF